MDSRGRRSMSAHRFVARVVRDALHPPRLRKPQDSQGSHATLGRWEVLGKNVKRG